MLESWFGNKTEAGEGVTRSADEQAAVDAATRKLALYHYETCWFCGRVRAAIRRLNLDIELRDIHRDRDNYARLVQEGGSGTVPCLLITNDDGSEKWLYESADIMDYLERRFGPPSG